MVEEKKALLLDMNSTFMFGEDRFSEHEDYSKYYNSIGGALPKIVVNGIINDVVEYLGKLYPSEEYRHKFPSVEKAIGMVFDRNLTTSEVEKIVGTFSYHEHGYIPPAYLKTLFKLEKRYKLAAVIDIWAPKDRWVETFEKHGIRDLFSALSFSSDHGMVKPSPKPFELVVKKLGLTKEQCLVVGDSIRRDLGGAKSAGIDCVLVGGASDLDAVATYSDLLEFCEQNGN